MPEARRLLNQLAGIAAAQQALRERSFGPGRAVSASCAQRLRLGVALRQCDVIVGCLSAAVCGGSTTLTSTPAAAALALMLR